MNPVEAHYTRGNLLETILDALRAAGKDLAHLSPDDLAAVDEFHSGQRRTTIRLAKLLALTGKERVLDVGSGLGGPARFLASSYGCRVSGVDLCAEFCRVAEALTQLTGLQGRVDFRQADALDLPFADQSFDVLWSQNTAMNIRDRDRLYREMRRVLVPGGRLGLQEIALGPAGAPYYPVPWAREAALSFLFSPEETRGKLEAAGLRVLLWQESNEPSSLAAPRRPAAGGPSVLGTHLILGAEWRAMAENTARNREERRIQPFDAVLERVD